jgi:hypothetical protein
MPPWENTRAAGPPRQTWASYVPFCWRFYQINTLALNYFGYEAECTAKMMTGVTVRHPKGMA